MFLADRIFYFFVRGYWGSIVFLAVGEIFFVYIMVRLEDIDFVCEFGVGLFTVYQVLGFSEIIVVIIWVFLLG